MEKKYENTFIILLTTELNKFLSNKQACLGMYKLAKCKMVLISSFLAYISKVYRFFFFKLYKTKTIKLFNLSTYSKLFHCA